MKQAQSNILILTGSIGSGHLSVAHAITDALYRVNGKHIHVETVDLLTALANFVTFATKKIYLGSLKISPKIYELIFSQSDESEWPLKILNALSAPFMQKQFFGLLREKQPRVLVSTYPVWDILVKKAWKKYCASAGKKLPFVSVITDCVSVHHSWTYGEPDYSLVANEDTAVTLKNLGVDQRRIKVFGYPISHDFEKHHSCLDFQQKLNLSPKRKTLLLILSTGVSWSRIKELAATIQKSQLKKLQLVIIACGSDRWEKKLKKIRWPWPTRITGWTNEMHAFIHGADIILTKAGGATVMECIASLKPMVIIDAIPGQEIGNAMLIQKYNLGAVLNRDLKNFDNVIEYILQHESLMQKNLAAQQKPNAAEEIAKFLLRLTDRSN
ncbi:hypothetical protein HYW83_04525 [Candidatus Peregrinibacteria bacterium]|nr:hypothetical protein [Candidatus Peregrinibacteria bacterium]